MKAYRADLVEKRGFNRPFSEKKIKSGLKGKHNQNVRNNKSEPKGKFGGGCGGKVGQ